MLTYLGRSNLSSRFPSFGALVCCMSLTSVPYSISYSEGQQLRYCGLGAKFEEVIIKGDPGEMKVRDLPYSHLIQVIDFL